MSKNISIRYQRKATLVILLALLGSSITIPNAYAVSEINWGGIGSAIASYNIETGSVGDPTQIIFEVSNDAFIGGGLSTVVVVVTSTDDPIGTTLTLTEQVGDAGIFRATIVFMGDNAIFQEGNTATITIQDNCDPGGPSGGTTGNCNPAMVETLTGGVDGATAKSDTDTTGVPVHFRETGENTGIFQGRLQFTTSGSSTSAPFPDVSTLRVSPGDTISIIDDVSLDLTNGFFFSSTGNKGAIRTSVGGTVTAEYPAGANSDDVSVGSGGFGGRGGGGLVAPILVVDAVASVGSSFGGSGCDGDCAPPTLGVDDTYRRLVNNGFSYNDHPVDVELFYTHYPLVTVNVGQENKAVLRIYDDLGPQNIAHVGLAFGLGKEQIFDESKASISLEINGEQTTVSKDDPENVLENIRAETMTEKCNPFTNVQCLVVTVYHTFRAPLKFNMVSTEVWDKGRNSWQNYYNDGVKINGDSLNPPKQYLAIHRGQQITITETIEDKAVDEFGNTWTFDREWIMDYVPPKKIDGGPTAHGYEREHVGFEAYKKEQIDIANQKLSEILNGKIIQSTFEKAPFSYDMNYVSRSEDMDLQLRVINEMFRAEQMAQRLYHHE